MRSACVEEQEVPGAFEYAYPNRTEWRREAARARATDERFAVGFRVLKWDEPIRDIKGVRARDGLCRSRATWERARGSCMNECELLLTASPRLESHAGEGEGGGGEADARGGARVQLEVAVEDVRVQRPAFSVSGTHTLFSVPA